jgi:hypothetical protein
MRRLWAKCRYIAANWKLFVHVLLRTYRFGVNNEWWSRYDSLFGLPYTQRWHLIENYRHARFRAVACHFIGPEEQRLMFPRHTDYKTGKI